MTEPTTPVDKPDWPAVPYRRAEGTLRPLLAAATTWAYTLTANGFDVIGASASLNRQSSINIEITGDEDDLGRALDVLALGSYWTSTTDHGDCVTVRASFHDVPGVTYVTIDAQAAAGESE